MTGIGTDIKEFTDNGLAEAAGLISRREYNLSIVRSRQTAEEIVKSYASEKNIEYTGLADTIERLFGEGAINRTSRDAFHNIRVYGNKAVHEKDNDPEDAQKAYYLLKNEVRTFLSRKTVSVDRTPVRIDAVPDSRRRPEKVEVELDPYGVKTPSRGHSVEGTEAGEPESAAYSQYVNGRRRPKGPGEPLRNPSGHGAAEGPARRQGAAPGRTAGGGRNTASGRVRRPVSKRSGGFNIYDLLRILIPIAAVILLIIIILSLIPLKKNSETTAPPSTAAPETTAPQTLPETEAQTQPETEPPEYEYKIKGEGVNIRYADNQNRIYTQLSNGTAIGAVTAIEGSDFVQFTLDGISVVVNKNYIEPIQ